MQPETKHSTMQLAERVAQDGATKDGATGDVATRDEIMACSGKDRPDAGPVPQGTLAGDCGATGNAGESEARQAPTPDELLGALSAHVKAQRLRVLELELALADAEARILSQAQLLCGTALAARAVSSAVGRCAKSSRRCCLPIPASAGPT